MKKGVFVFLLIFSFVRFYASEIKSDVTNYYEASTNLNVRTGAGKKYPISFTLKKGDEVELIAAKNKNWSEIKYSGKIGFVSSKYLIQSKRVSDKINRSRSHIFFYFIITIVAIIFLILIFKIIGKLRVVIKKRKDNILLETVTDLKRGTWSERDLVLRFLKSGVPKDNIFHDLYVKNNDENFAQIDLAVITQVGIIVFEIKDYQGWIYGNGNYTQWTHVFGGNKKYPFYNPIKQNNKHIEVLKKQVNFENLPFFSVIVFYGNCILKDISFVPHATYITKAERVFEVVNLILSSNDSIEYSFRKYKIINVLKESQNNGKDYKVQEQHINNIQDMLGTNRIFE